MQSCAQRNEPILDLCSRLCYEQGCNRFGVSNRSHVLPAGLFCRGSEGTCVTDIFDQFLEESWAWNIRFASPLSSRTSCLKRLHDKNAQISQIPRLRWPCVSPNRQSNPLFDSTACLKICLARVERRVARYFLLLQSLKQRTTGSVLREGGRTKFGRGSRIVSGPADCGNAYKENLDGAVRIQFKAKCSAI